MPFVLVVEGAEPLGHLAEISTLGTTRAARIIDSDGWLPCGHNVAGEVVDEPVAGQRRGLLERAGLLEQVRGPGHDGQPGLAPHAGPAPAG